MTSIISKLGLGGQSASRSSRNGAVESLPLYSPIAASESSTYRRSESETDPSADDDDETETGELLHPAQRHAGAGATTKTAAPGFFGHFDSTRFLADFTLGFADGLTVPFALTAGLSSLGQTDTVIYAGMAEICAGSISMGIGGYLSARGERKAAAAAAAASTKGTTATSVGVGEWQANDPEKEAATPVREAVVTSYLDPLGLPPGLAEMVLEHVRGRPEICEVLLQKANGDDDDDDEADRLASPILIGSSVSLGYLLGGLLPLFPYFFVSHVGDGLLWSFVVCVVALFIFGFSKDFALSRHHDEGALRQVGRQWIPWGDVGRSAWEGAQMVILGSVAALAAVLCVRLFEGFSVASSEPAS